MSEWLATVLWRGSLVRFYTAPGSISSSPFPVGLPPVAAAINRNQRLPIIKLGSSSIMQKLIDSRRSTSLPQPQPCSVDPAQPSRNPASSTQPQPCSLDPAQASRNPARPTQPQACSLDPAQPSRNPARSTQLNPAATLLAAPHLNPAGQKEGCLKSAEGGGTPHCKGHGGGKRCQEEGCTKSAIGGTPH